LVFVGCVSPSAQTAPSLLRVARRKGSLCSRAPSRYCRHHVGAASHEINSASGSYIFPRSLCPDAKSQRRRGSTQLIEPVRDPVCRRPVQRRNSAHDDVPRRGRRRLARDDCDWMKGLGSMVTAGTMTDFFPCQPRRVHLTCALSLNQRNSVGASARLNGAWDHVPPCGRNKM
jgi:hypothetical protein